MNQYAIAVFVKTIGFSPLKTRLAKDLGREAAHHFYQLSCLSILEQLQVLNNRLEPYWAVAEKIAEVKDYWQEFSLVEQGSGELDDRLAKVYHELLQRYSGVLLIGADAPQITPEILGDVIDCFQKQDFDFVIGPAKDGGFYLFAGSKPLPLEFWQSVPYSQEHTFEILVETLKSYGSIRLLQTLADVDYAKDLEFLRHELAELTSLSSAQKALFAWLNRLKL